MTFTTITAAHDAAARFNAEFGGEAYCYRFHSVPRGYRVAVHSIQSGAFLAYV